MGLEKLDGMGVPDNKGGRPTKEEQEDDYGRFAEGEPLTKKTNNEDWWRVQYNSLNEDYEDTKNLIIEMAEHISTSPIEIRLKLEKFGIHETDWEWYVEEYKMYQNDMRIAHKLNAAGIETPDKSSTDSSGGNTLFDDVQGVASDSSDDDDVSGGLSSLIDK